MVANEREALPRGLSLNRGIEGAIDWLHARQAPEGFWVGMLESNSCMEAEWLLAMHFLSVEDHPKKQGIIRCILNKQRKDGAWEIYHDAPRGDINATVECYAALRAVGMSPDDERLRRAREWIFDHGGLTKVRVFTRYWLALLGEWPWEKTPNIPPEIIFFPTWFPFSIYNFSSWARATIVAISILSAHRPVRPLPEDRRLDELFPGGRERMDHSLPRKIEGGLSWKKFFLAMDKVLHGYQKLGLLPARKSAIKHALEWIVRHQDADGAWGGIQPPWIYSMMALHVEGYPLTHPVLSRALAALDEHWSYEKDGGIHIQASESPVWDTLLSLMAMQDCDEDYGSSTSMSRAVDWVLDQQVRTGGDWQVKVKGVQAGAWAFERANNFYPDLDDTAVALIVLARLRELGGDARLDESIRLAWNWVLGMQSSNGGWAAFDRDNDKTLLTQIPFCDFGEALDPPSVDVTAHVLEAFGLLRMERGHPAVAKALEYVRSEQESDGSWFGRWGVNHIYGTAAVLPALHAIGEDMNGPYVRRAADWIVEHQNADGGWGESCGSYMDDSLRGKGSSTASQTGWALMALLSTESADYMEAIQRGVDYLLSRQQDGTWEEPHYTGTGFPGYGVGFRIKLSQQDLAERLHQGAELSRGFMINYNMYRHYFPLMALGRARRYFKTLQN